MNSTVPLLIALLTAMAACVGLAVWAMAERSRARQGEARAAGLEAEGVANIEAIRAQAALAAGAVGDQLVQRATETFQAQDRLAQAKLEAQLKPVAETLAKFEAQVTAAEKARAEETGGLKEQIAQLLAASVATQDEARKLSTALRRGAGVQGRWGEEMLRNVLEMAGLKAGVDFDEQVHIASDGVAQRPDVVVRLPGGGVFVIDSKCSLTAYLEGLEGLDEASREACFQRHVLSLRGHVTTLAGKAYWDRFDRSPDFVVMFVPGDPILAAAAERAPTLYTEAMERRVILATPSNLFALCKIVAWGWRAEQQALNAKQIVDLGRELYKRVSVMGGYVQAMGKALETVVGRYNQFIGSLETQVHTQARRFEDLKVDHEDKAIPELAPLEPAVRPLVKLTATAAPASDAPTLTLVEAAPTSAP